MTEYQTQKNFNGLRSGLQRPRGSTPVLVLRRTATRGFCELYHQVSWDECILKMHFWSRLNNKRIHIISMGNDRSSLFEYIKYTLWVACSPLIVEKESHSTPSMLVQDPPVDIMDSGPTPTMNSSNLCPPRTSCRRKSLRSRLTSCVRRPWNPCLWEF